MHVPSRPSRHLSHSRRFLLPAKFEVTHLVNTPTNTINRNDPPNSYNAIYLQHVFATVDAFKGFSNTLAFFSGNEVVNDVNNTFVPVPIIIPINIRPQLGSKP